MLGFRCHDSRTRRIGITAPKQPLNRKVDCLGTGARHRDIERFCPETSRDVLAPLFPQEPRLLPVAMGRGRIARLPNRELPRGNDLVEDRSGCSEIEVRHDCA